MKNCIPKLILFSLLLILECQIMNAQAPVFEWARTMSPQNGQCIAVDSLGGVYTVGPFSGMQDFDPGPSTFYLTPLFNGAGYISKLDVIGNFVWAKQIAGVSSSSQADCRSIKVDRWGNIYCTGGFSGTVDFDTGIGIFNLTSFGSQDIFILKLDPFGNFLWAKQMGGDVCRNMCVDIFGSVYTTGLFSSIVDFDPGASIFNLNAVYGTQFISKLDSSGNFVWARNVAGDGWSITVDNINSVYTTGVSNLSWNIIISKLDSVGNLVWIKNIGGSGNDAGGSIISDASSNLYITGWFFGTVDFDPNAGVVNLVGSTSNDNIFILKLDSAGNFIWASSPTGIAWAGGKGTGISADSAGSVYYAGTFSGILDFDPGPGLTNVNSIDGTQFISKLDSSGNLLWVKNMGGQSRSIATNTTGNVYTTGNFNGPQDFDPDAGVFNLSSGGAGSIFVLKLHQCTPTYSSLSQTNCTNYTWNGQTYSTSGNYAQALINSQGCDSIITLNLTIYPSTISYISQTACDNYTFYGNTYTASGTYTHNFINASGCDSTFALNLTISPSTISYITQTVCDTFTLNGNSYSASGTYTQTLISAFGCDSTLVLNLTINPSGISYITQSVCDTFTLNGNSYSTSGIYTQTLVNSLGCDSALVLDLTIYPSSSTYTTQTACDIYTFNGNTYTLSGTYSQSFVNALGCDSIHTLDLTINSVINSITQAGSTLSANAVGATYQWITCKDSLNIPGATNQIYTAIANGNYAVIVTQNGCIDTSDCHTVTGVSVNDYLESNSIQIFPNPTKDIIYITSIVPFKNVSIKIVNVMGEVIIEKEHLSGNHFEFYISNEANGVYFIEIKTSEGIKSAKLLKE